MTRPGRFPLRLAIFGALVVWFAGDLLVFHGPLRRHIDRVVATRTAKSQGVVARVFNHRITRDQLERAMHERLWLEGKTPADLTPDNLKLARYAALEDLIDHELLRVKAKVNATELKVEDEEINARLRRLLGRFESKGAMEAAMKSQGIASESDLRDRLAARIQQEKYVELKTGPLAVVTEAEARAWFEQNRDKLALPERVRARHVFIATLNRPEGDARTTLETALADLAAGKTDFATLAATLSEDPASKSHGGDLGWMSRARLPADFAGPVFSLPAHTPTLLRTRIGWHLVEVTDRKPPESRDFGQAKDEVFAALESVKRREAAREFRSALRRFEAEKIDIYHDMLAE